MLSYLHHLHTITFKLTYVIVSTSSTYGYRQINPCLAQMFIPIDNRLKFSSWNCYRSVPASNDQLSIFVNNTHIPNWIICFAHNLPQNIWLWYFTLFDTYLKHMCGRTSAVVKYKMCSRLTSHIKHIYHNYIPSLTVCHKDSMYSSGNSK